LLFVAIIALLIQALQNEFPLFLINLLNSHLIIGHNGPILALCYLQSAVVHLLGDQPVLRLNQNPIVPAGQLLSLVLDRLGLVLAGGRELDRALVVAELDGMYFMKSDSFWLDWFC
jgi:hypothetical protein